MISQSWLEYFAIPKISSKSTACNERNITVLLKRMHIFTDHLCCLSDHYASTLASVKFFCNCTRVNYRWNSVAAWHLQYIQLVYRRLFSFPDTFYIISQWNKAVQEKQPSNLCLEETSLAFLVRWPGIRVIQQWLLAHWVQTENESATDKSRNSTQEKP